MVRQLEIVINRNLEEPATRYNSHFLLVEETDLINVLFYLFNMDIFKKIIRKIRVGEIFFKYFS